MAIPLSYPAVWDDQEFYPLHEEDDVSEIPPHRRWVTYLYNALEARFPAWFVKGNCHDALLQESEATNCYTSCITLRPEFAGSWFNRGRAHLRQLHYRQAIVDLDRALTLDADLADAYLDRALAGTPRLLLPAGLLARLDAGGQGENDLGNRLCQGPGEIQGHDRGRQAQGCQGRLRSGRDNHRRSACQARALSSESDRLRSPDAAPHCAKHS